MSDPDPVTYDLCARHADRFVAPVGWTLHDLRTSGESPAVAKADEPVPDESPLPDEPALEEPAAEEWAPASVQRVQA